MVFKHVYYFPPYPIFVFMGRQTGYRVLPPQANLDPATLAACQNLYNKAEALINQNTGRLLHQRVTVNEIPAAKGVGVYKNKRGNICVYGTDRKAYCPNYQKDFYGCSFM